jgi:hypothetical protein
LATAEPPSRDAGAAVTELRPVRVTARVRSLMIADEGVTAIEKIPRYCVREKMRGSGVERGGEREISTRAHVRSFQNTKRVTGDGAWQISTGRMI